MHTKQTPRYLPSAERGTGHTPWLKSFHSFSFGHYHNPHWPGFYRLRVLNDDTIAPQQGFALHGHKDMTILTLILSGTLEHQDTLGNRTQLVGGTVQVMEAGTGIRHSEMNPSTSDPCQLYQIWLLPPELQRTPRYEESRLPLHKGLHRHEALTCVASPTGQHSSLKNATAVAPVALHQETWVYWLNTLSKEKDESATEITENMTLPRTAGQALWIQIYQGSLHVQGHTLHAGDGLALEPTVTEETLLLEGQAQGCIIVMSVA
jgi:redox-sensitive bicupin YhaK (pirin superfamily)